MTTKLSNSDRVRGPDDPRILLYRNIADAELMRSHGLFVAEGRLVVRRVLEDARYRVHSILVNNAAHRELEPLLRGMAAAQVLRCDTSEFLGITGLDIHRGCLALVERPAARSIDEILGSADRIVVLEEVGNPDNIGGVFRNAAAFGAGAVVLSPSCCDPLYRKAIRTSMGAVLKVPFARAEDWPADLVRLRTAGFTVVALTPREPSEPLDVFADRWRTSRIALVAGHEGTGLTLAVEAAADHRVRIPTTGYVDSLNVAVAVGIALYALK